MDGNWWIWAGDYGTETASIYAVRKGRTGFSNVKCLTSHLQSICEVGTGAGEQVNGMVNGTSLTLGLFAGSGASRDSRIMGAEIVVNNELPGLRKVTEGGFVSRSWFDGSEERM